MTSQYRRLNQNGMIVKASTLRRWADEAQAQEQFKITRPPMKLTRGERRRRSKS